MLLSEAQSKIKEGQIANAKKDRKCEIMWIIQ